MVYGDTSRYPIHINMKLRILYISNKLLMNSNTLSGSLYRLVLKYIIYNSNWLLHVKSNLDNSGLCYVWNS
jgi:hypothetical protein